MENNIFQYTNICKQVTARFFLVNKAKGVWQLSLILPGRSHSGLLIGSVAENWTRTQRWSPDFHSAQY